MVLFLDKYLAISRLGLSRNSSILDLNAESETTHVNIGLFCYNFIYLTYDPMRFCFINFSRCLHQRRILLVASYYEPRIDSYTVPSHSRSWLENITLGCLFANAISSQTSIFKLSHIKESSLAKAICTSLLAFSVSLVISAVRASVIWHWPFTNTL